MGRMPVDAAAWDRRYAASEGVWGAEPNVWVAQELNGLAPGRALDLGAGEGRHAVWLAERGWPGPHAAGPGGSTPHGVDTP
jgi:hypothetical protein